MKIPDSPLEDAKLRALVSGRGVRLRGEDHAAAARRRPNALPRKLHREAEAAVNVSGTHVYSNGEDRAVINAVINETSATFQAFAFPRLRQEVTSWRPS